MPKQSRRGDHRAFCAAGRLLPQNSRRLVSAVAAKKGESRRSSAAEASDSALRRLRGMPSTMEGFIRRPCLPPPPCFHPGKPAPGVLISSHRCRPALWDSLANCLDRDKTMKATSSRRVDGALVVRLELAVAHVRHVAPPLFWVSSPPSPDFGVCWFVLDIRRWVATPRKHFLTSATNVR